MKHRSLVSLIRDYQQEARAAGVPRSTVMRATSATRRAFAAESDNSGSLALRTRSYFWKTVRGTALRTREGSLVVSRLVLSSVVEDLRGSGRDADALWDELQRGWSDKIPLTVLEEYRDRLCA